MFPGNVPSLKKVAEKGNKPNTAIAEKMHAEDGPIHSALRLPRSYIFFGKTSSGYLSSFSLQTLTSHSRWQQTTCSHHRSSEPCCPQSSVLPLLPWPCHLAHCHLLKPGCQPAVGRQHKARTLLDIIRHCFPWQFWAVMSIK